jgi:hypothetical protein
VQPSVVKRRRLCAVVLKEESQEHMKRIWVAVLRDAGRTRTKQLRDEFDVLIGNPRVA